MPKPDKNEIYETLDTCTKADEEESKYPGMTYEQGVNDTIRWLIDGKENPVLSDDS